MRRGLAPLEEACDQRRRREIWLRSQVLEPAICTTHSSAYAPKEQGVEAARRA